MSKRESSGRSCTLFEVVADGKGERKVGTQHVADIMCRKYCFLYICGAFVSLDNKSVNRLFPLTI
jgi:hypothetical protein